MSKRDLALLLTHLLGQDVIGWIDEQRPHTSWRAIAARLNEACAGKATASWEILRRWHVEYQRDVEAREWAALHRDASDVDPSLGDGAPVG